MSGNRGTFKFSSLLLFPLGEIRFAWLSGSFHIPPGCSDNYDIRNFQLSPSPVT